MVAEQGSGVGSGPPLQLWGGVECTINRVGVAVVGVRCRGARAARDRGDGVAGPARRPSPAVRGALRAGAATPSARLRSPRGGGWGGVATCMVAPAPPVQRVSVSVPAGAEA